jgi:hypothetical protein
MKNNILATAAALSDGDLLARINTLALTERGATAELVAHLAVLEMRPNAHRAEGYGSLFAYCTGALHLSEDAACNRIDAARLSRSFPVILDLLADGSVTLTAIRMLKQHLTPENHESVLSRASHRRKDEIQVLIAELAPKPDVASTVRKLPESKVVSDDLVNADATLPGFAAGPAGPVGHDDASPRVPAAAPPSPEPVTHPLTDARASSPHRSRAVAQPLSPQRYRVQFTMGEESQQRLRRLQSLLRGEIPTGDVGAIFERALVLLLENVEKKKLGAPARRARVDRDDGSTPNDETRIRPGTDIHSRSIPEAVRHTVWSRDGGQCAFVSETGRRCSERSFLEFHHIHPYALNGPTSVGNISLRCRGHNVYEAELVFGPRVTAESHAIEPGGP